ncbi:hypothetical protein HI914_05578 [Erysiphe necator]|uniref:Wax synthase domain-containing protein n=1 Tax=Uncinula necator TaxID=52586 RepID=A0A0B1P1A1_UNCNE|nr:hypothetical protein HI914_05578 [Erysiphe necator]KHJ31070.1 hypothetical protein EV44_g6119 [Erysiphe necator]
MEHYLSNLTWAGSIPTSNEIYSVYRDVLEHKLSNGTLILVIFPYHLLGFLLMTAYLCIPHKESPKIYALRWPLLAFINWFEFRMIWKTSSVGPGMGSFAGSLSAYTILASWTWLIFKKPQWEAKRIQRIIKRVPQIKNEITSTKSEDEIPQNKDLRQRNANGSLKASSLSLRKDEFQNDNIDVYHYFWQSYPDNFKERISWVVDLLYNYRGPGWNWAISSIPSLPPEILMRAGDPVPKRNLSNFSPTGSRRFNSRYEHLVYRVSLLLFCYFALDVLKTVMMKDPYFKFGPNTYALPSYLQSLTPSALQFYRIVVTSIGIITVMTTTLNLIPLLSCIMGPKVLGLRAEPWYYPTEWGYFSNIYKNGLGGLWGDYWHQSFRLHFTSPTNFLIREGYIKPGTFIAKTTSLFCAFFLSGFLHWASSSSTLPPTRPSHAMYFFVLQGVGIMLQRALCQCFSRYITKFPTFLRRTGNFIFVLIWLHKTGWLLADDFARTGLWLMDPVPISFSQLLGFGEVDAGWISKRRQFRWFQGKNWWEIGFALA